MEYSKGDWKIYQLKSNNVSVCVKTEGDLVAVEIASLNVLLGYDAVVANAQLISAAPELYEACNLALQYFLAHDIDNKVISGMSLQLNEAIAKAEGK